MAAGWVGLAAAGLHKLHEAAQSKMDLCHCNFPFGN